ncbi:MAG: hypothetical protein ACQCN3_08865 [Candidatus Bathyarchaeia archaeon]|jgi:hypothetical protein
MQQIEGAIIINDKLSKDVLEKDAIRTVEITARSIRTTDKQLVFKVQEKVIKKKFRASNTFHIRKKEN